MDKVIRVRVVRVSQREFRIEKDSAGVKLLGRNKEAFVHLRKGMLSETECLRRVDGKKSFKVMVEFFPEEFGIDCFSLYPDKDAGNLARELHSLGASFPARQPTAQTSEFDLEFNFEDKAVVLEITRASRSLSQSSLNCRHGAGGSNIRSHVFGAYSYCVNRVLQGDCAYAFVLLPADWRVQNHIPKLINDCEKVGCRLVTTDFSDSNWPKIAARETIRVLGSK